METYITSDLHLGSEHSRHAAFLTFLESLPDGARLVLNGDIVNHFVSGKTLTEAHRRVLYAIRAASYEREVIWIRGNNDRRLALDDVARIQFVDDFAIDNRVYIAHGHRFDRLMPTARVFLVPMRWLYEGIARLVGARMHVAQFAKRLSGLYGVLCNHVARNAVRYAKRHGYGAVVCGHTHFVEDREINGIRYCNTGCWTENHAAVVVVGDDADKVRVDVLASISPYQPMHQENMSA